jgi:hypothetical protein
MSTVAVYLVILVIAGLAILMDLVFVYNKKKRSLSRLAGLAFAFVIAGIYLGGQKLIGYSLLGIGIMLAIIDILRKARANVKS